MLNTFRLRFTNNKLFEGKTDTGFSIVKDEVGLYKVKWPDGELSADHYNLTWAKENCKYMFGKTLGRAENDRIGIADELKKEGSHVST